MRCWRECKVSTAAVETAWRFPQKLDTELPQALMVILLGLYPEEVKAGIQRCWFIRAHSSILPDSQKARQPNQLSLMEKHGAVRTDVRTVLSLKKGGDSGTL